MGLKGVKSNLTEEAVASGDGADRRFGSAESIEENSGGQEGREVMGNTRDRIPETSQKPGVMTG